MRHDSAVGHVTGAARYLDDVPTVPGTLEAALVLSPLAHARVGRIDLSRALAAPGVVAAVVLAAIVLVVELGGERLPSDTPELSGAAAGDSIATSSEVAYALGASAQLDSASVEATPAGGMLIARTWTNVRRSRSRRAELEAVLTPGDTVFADSLQRDWYRVSYEGEVMGYAHRTTLTTPGR